MRKKKKKTEKQKLIEKADKLWGQLVRQGRRCARCNGEATQPHHIVSRTRKNTRWLKENGLPLCYPCHSTFMHGKPTESMQWLRQRLGDEFIDNLLKEAQKKFTPTIENLKEIIKNLEEQLDGSAN